MKVLQINCVYQTGSTGKITADIHHVLTERGIESVVCYGRGAKCSEAHVYKTCGESYSHVQHFFANVSGTMYGGCWLSTNRLISIIKREKPDIVHLQCINGYFVNIYRLIGWLKKNHIKTVLTLHAEFMYTANCGHALDCDRWKTGCGSCPRLKKETSSFLFDGTSRSWKKMQKAFEGFGENLSVVSVSPWLRDRARQSPILRNFSHTVIFNGLDTDVFHLYDTAELRRKHNLNHEKVVFHATPSFSADPDHIKGGYYVLELAKQMPDVRFFIAGPCTEPLDIPENVTMLGKISDQGLLARYYSMADATVLTSKKETFSMVTAESLCCGTPVVGFKAGAPEQIAIPEYSSFVDFGDLHTMGQALKKCLSAGYHADILSEQAKALYGSHVMCESYYRLYENMMGTDPSDRWKPES